jgi:hypothetical protein
LDRLLEHSAVVSVEALSQEIAGEEAGHHALRRDAIIIPVDLSVYDRLLTLPAREEVASV